MTARRVVVTLELVTKAPLSVLRGVLYWRSRTGLSVTQAQANVIRARHAAPRRRKRRRMGR